MPKYQNPNFSKERYWQMRNSDAPARRMIRLALRNQHNGKPDSVSLNPLTKKAFLKNSKRARQFQALFDNIQLEVVDAN